ncbi:facilitated trehalose transporter Tret1-2 homolog [Malaya genurostris]|uniref:facilitated trehalose transporter Tret1-2 homolog n=1 Tax=Malaya genurostris TaxID=325434 RepID=UPI0026F40435|nr:facilitated trehalose transporter Tret1-2 homolog [Malaya genurostris]XP_058447709.1 facilitated trehalose transporter Tret1-2 homolog [Malaya genurostris]XP_058447710.1 facilitated trehalose transporter Tret1-2 homolog [Malaya genurostris]
MATVKHSYHNAVKDERQLTGKNNLQLIKPSLISVFAKDIENKDIEETCSLYGSAAELAKRANRRSDRMQLTMSILANLTVLSSGMGLGYSAITLHSLTREDNPLRLNAEQASWFASISAIACPFGGLISGYLLDRIGRKWTLTLINILSIVSWALIAVSSRTNFEQMYTQILIARVIIGLVIGLVSAPASIYSAEIATPRMRGRLTVLTSLAIALGILIIYSFGYFIPENFRLVAGIASGCCVVFLLLLLPLTESPAWLLSKQREQDAERSLKRIRGYGSCRKVVPEIELELERLRNNIEAQRLSGKESLINIVKQPQVYKPLGVIIGFFGFQQFSGIFVVIVYAAKVSSEASVSIDPFLCTVLIGVARVVATVLVAYILDTWGRKPPSILSGVGMAACMFGIAACIHFPLPEELRWIPTFLMIAYIFTSTLGFLTMPFAMLAELFPQKIRGPASGVSVFFTYLMSFVIIKLYPTMVANMGSANVFIFYGVISIIGVMYVYHIVPETKGKSLQEIEDYFRGKSANDRSSQSVEDELSASSL